MNETAARPDVSVVIPTHQRPELLMERALRSALAQTFENLEVVVVIDGPDPETVARLDAVKDSRVRYVALPDNVGGAEARNIGVRASRGEYVAFLDDDDEWMPTKLERQLDTARRSSAPYPIVVSGWITRTPRGDTPFPPRFPAPGESIGDYMLARPSAWERTCGFMSSVIFAPRQLLLDVPFTTGLPKHQDWDWVLRASAHPGVQFEFLRAPASIWYFEEAREHMSKSLNWRTSMQWAHRMREQGLLSDKAYAGFINSHLAPYAQKANDPSAILPLWRELLSAKPRAFEIVRYVVTWLLPLEQRRRARQVLEGFLKSPAPARQQSPVSSRAAPVTEIVRHVDTREHSR